MATQKNTVTATFPGIGPVEISRERAEQIVRLQRIIKKERSQVHQTDKAAGYDFVENPVTVEDYVQNVQFQFDNVSGWLGAKKYESALIKARYLVQALEDLEKHCKEIEEFNQQLNNIQK